VSNPLAITGISNIAAIPVGARVSGTGVGREVYVRAKNISTNSITLSQPLWGGSGTRSYSFERYAYMLDFSGFDELSKFELRDIEFSASDVASGVTLADTGSVCKILNCTFSVRI
jgi:hypothetical protein